MQPLQPRARTALAAVLGILASVLFTVSSSAVTDVDLSGRMLIDGLTNEWESDESLFQTNPDTGGLEEPISDSKWGFFNDLNQIRITWDARFLYVAVDAIIWNNNVIVLLDYKDGGMQEMTNLNSWRRNFVFQGLQPDLFLATWDGNTLPQVWDYVGSNQVTQKDAASFQTVASFSTNSQNRAMEAAIPWSFLLGDDAQRVFDPAYGDTVYVLPEGISRLRVVGVITAGPDGTGGPDSAPDNLSGHDIDSSQQVTIDNWADIPLDLDGDDVVDFDANIRDREIFRVRPPVRGVRLEIRGVALAHSIISPEQGGRLDFATLLSPEVSPDEDFRTVSLSAEIYDLNGEKVRTLYRSDVRSAAEPHVSALDTWDGRDDRGGLVPGGIYVLRLVIEPDANRYTKAFTVVR